MHILLILFLPLFPIPGRSVFDVFIQGACLQDKLRLCLLQEKLSEFNNQFVHICQSFKLTDVGRVSENK